MNCQVKWNYKFYPDLTLQPLHQIDGVVIKEFPNWKSIVLFDKISKKLLWLLGGVIYDSYGIENPLLAIDRDRNDPIYFNIKKWMKMDWFLIQLHFKVLIYPRCK